MDDVGFSRLDFQAKYFQTEEKKNNFDNFSETCAGILEIGRRQISSAHLVSALQVKH